MKKSYLTPDSYSATPTPPPPIQSFSCPSQTFVCWDIGIRGKEREGPVRRSTPLPTPPMESNDAARASEWHSCKQNFTHISTDTRRIYMDIYINLYATFILPFTHFNLHSILFFLILSYSIYIYIYISMPVTKLEHHLLCRLPKQKKAFLHDAIYTP